MKHKVKHLHFIADKARNRETIARGGPAFASLAQPPMPHRGGLT